MRRLEILTLSKPNLQKWLRSYENSSAFSQNTSAIANYTAIENLEKAYGIREELLQYFHMDEAGEATRQKTLDILIENLDDHGYLRESTLALAKENNISSDELISLRQKMMAFENLGIGCYHFPEFLEFQLRRGGSKLTEKLPTLLRLFSEKRFLQHRPLLFLRNLKKRLPAPEWRLLLDEIRKTNIKLKPIYDSKFSPLYDAHPDLEFAVVGEKWDILYYNTPEELQLMEPDYSPLAPLEEIRDALAQRRQTLILIGHEIFKIQQPFLRGGAEALKPFTQLQLAHHLRVAPSTISRAIRQKCIKTPLGTFPLALFLQSARQLFSFKMESRLRRLWRDFPDSLFLPDGDLAALFEEKFAITLSRRTICKYRNHLLN